MPKFEVEVQISSAVATYEVVAQSEQEALLTWDQGRFLSLDQVFGGWGSAVSEDIFADDDDEFEDDE